MIGRSEVKALFWCAILAFLITVLGVRIKEVLATYGIESDRNVATCNCDQCKK